MKKLTTYVTFLIFTVLSQTVSAQTLFDGDEPVDGGDGAKYVAWFGWYSDTYYPWVYHEGLGWLYVVGEDTDSIWAYHLELGWLWTSNSAYPYLYSVSERDYIYYLPGTMGPRWYYHLSVNRWLDETGETTTPYAVDLYLRGTMNGFGAPATDRFRFVSDEYVLARTLQAGTYSFKIADANWTNGTDLGGVSSAPLGTPVTLMNSPGGGDVELVIPEDGTYLFTLDASDPAMPVLTVTEDTVGPVLAEPVYLVGTFNNYASDAESQMNLIGGGRYHIPLTIRASDQMLRLQSAQSYGGPVSGGVDIGMPFSLTQGSNEAVEVRFPKPGVYDVIADFGVSATNPQVTIEYRNYVDLGPYGEDLFLNGYINGEERLLSMVRDGNLFEWYGHLDPGTHQFVISDEAASDPFTFGGAGNITTDTAYTLDVSDQRMSLVVAAGAGGVYRVALDASNAQSPVLRVTQPNVMLVHYHRADPFDYEGWGLHLFNVDGGNALPASVETTWPVIYPVAFEDAFGRYAAVPIEDEADTFGIVVHKSGGDQDMEVRVTPSEAGSQIWLVEGVSTVFTNEVDAFEAIRRITRAAARWIDVNAIAWNIPGGDAYQYRFYAHPTGEIFFENGEITLGDGGTEVALSLMDDPILEDELVGEFPYTSNWTYIDASAIGDPAAALQGHVVIAAFDTNGDAVAASALQRAGVIDDLFFFDGGLGVLWDNGVPTLRVWAPTALDVQLHVAVEPDLETQLAGSPFQMQKVMDGESWTGAWEYTGDAGWDGAFYVYNVEVFVPNAQEVVHNIVTDPYSISLSTDSLFSQIVDPSDASLMPEGWTALAKPGMTPEDIIIYELHVRDFSISDETVPQDARGTFKAFTYTDSDGMQHLDSLANAGLSHVHFLPIYDFGSVDEFSPYLREFWPNPVGFAVDSEEQQDVTVANDGIDGFNWGYDPYHYLTPEGSYATDASGASRIFELREAVQSLWGIDLRVVQDVVFNHTFQAGQQEKSVLDKVVPGYYYRLDGSGNIHTDVCCPEVATENLMAQKLMVDAIVHWARTYKIDGFRFDLMGDHTLDNLMAVRTALDGLTLAEDGVDGEQIYLYGEGWSFGSLLNYLPGESANQNNLGGTGIGSFNDRIRNGLGHRADDGFIDGDFGSIDQVRNGLAANLSNVSWPNVSPSGTYTEDPEESVNYITAHDNYTLFDELMLRHGTADGSADLLDTVLRRHRLALGVLAVAQGVPFYHAGVDILRSKSGDRNSYNSGDWFNMVDWSYMDNNWAVGLPPSTDGDNVNNWPHWEAVFPNEDLWPTPAMIEMTHDYFTELLTLRRSSELFRLETASAISRQLRFLSAEEGGPAGLIVVSLTDPGEGAEDLDPEREWMVVLLNGNEDSVSFSYDAFAAEGMDLTLHPVLAGSADAVTAGAATYPDGNSISVPGLTLLVYQATVLPELPDIGNTPTYSRDIFIRGDMNNWGNDGLTAADMFSYEGNATYELAFDLAPGTYQFKVADAEWTNGTNFGAPFGTDIVPGETIELNGGDNIALTIAEAGTYLFTLKATNAASPSLTVASGGVPPYERDIFIRGDMNNWGNGGLTPDDMFTYAGDNVYTLEYVLDAGSYGMKVADADWSGGTNFGGSSGATLEPGGSVILNGGDNVTLTVPVSGTYVFTLDATNAGSPTLSFNSNDAPTYNRTIYLRGDMNNWGNDGLTETDSFDYIGNNIYQLDFMLNPGSYSFKIADADWSGGTNFGGNVSFVIDQPETLQDGAFDNASFSPEAAGTYRFILDASQPSSPQLTISLAP